MEQLDGKVAVITGGAAGIGLALAEAFAAQGTKLVLADIDGDALHATVDRLAERGLEVMGVVTDVTDPDSVDALRDAAVDRFGTVHVVCNNAGVGSVTSNPSWETAISEWSWVFAVNTMGVVNGIRSFVPLLVEQGEGHVVNTASAAALGGMPFYGPYTASKHATFGLSVALSLELQAVEAGVGVSVLCPDFLRSGIANSDRLWPDALQPQPEKSADPVSQFMQTFFKDVVDQAPGPEGVAADAVAAVLANRFLVRTDTPLMDSILAGHQRVLDGERPSTPV